MKTSGVWVFTLVAFFALGTTSGAQAALLAYEGFDYDPGPLGGQSGGMGFNGAWILGGNASNNLVRSGSFGYTDTVGNVLETSGNRGFSTGDGTAAGDDTGGNNSSSSPRRTLTFTRGNGDEPDVTWMSFLALRTGKTLTVLDGNNDPIEYARAVGVQLFNRADGTTAQGNELLSIGRGTQTSETVSLPNDTWGMLYRGDSNFAVASNVPFSDPQPVFMLLRVDHAVGINPGNDVARLWISPASLAIEPSLGTEDLLISAGQFSTTDRDFNFNQLRIFAGNNTANVGYGSIEYDEIRIGTTFDSVTPYIPAPNPIPEPASVLLACLSLIGLLPITNRRRD
jgi:hypothetical protein